MEPVEVKTVSKCNVSVDKLSNASGLSIKDDVFLHEMIVNKSRKVKMPACNCFIRSKVL